jgi:predicted component of type VI protein secretion system
MKREVAATLGELERKLRELESELAAVSRVEDVQEPPARVIDEAPQAQPVEAQPVEAQLGEAQFAEPQPSEAPQAQAQAQPTPVSAPVERPEERLSIDLLELVAFKEKLEQTMNGLVEEYARILSLRGPE